LQTRCRGRDPMSAADLTAAVQPWVEALWSFYRTGDETKLTGLATPRGLERLRAIDWRVAAVERNDVRFREVAKIIDLNDWQEWCTDGSEVVGFDIEPILDIQAGARTFDASRKVPIEAVQGEQRRAIAMSFVRAPGSDGWLLDDVRPSEFRPSYMQPRTARPCPGLKKPGRAANPLLLEPWCTANGDGRKLAPGGYGNEIGAATPDCLGGATEIAIGLPPGTRMGFDNTRFYVRDPQGKARRALGPEFATKGFRRDYRPPRDAISTGITNGYATIWTSETLGDKWLLLQVGNRFERWPQSLGGCGPA
jgi:hypothetical protein